MKRGNKDWLMFEVPGSRQNHLLSLLTKDESRRLLPCLELVKLSLGETLSEPGGQLTRAYFPTTAIVSLMYIMQNGVAAEVAIVGNDGIVGIPLYMDEGITAYRAVVQSAGNAYCLKARLLKLEFNRAGSMHHVLLRYALTRLHQVAQTAVCNRHHTVDQQLCRWLLLGFDRRQSRDMSITQQQIAAALGVRREGVTEAAGKLQKAGLIRYHRGHITMLDRAAMKELSCECYEAVRNGSRPS
jgi:hypothetical protein